MSDPEEVWRRKSDDDVRAAVVKLGEYTDDGKKIILAEFERRHLGASGAPPSHVDSQQLQGSEEAVRSPAMWRYQDGYRVVNFVIWVGGVIKWLGIVVALLAIFFAVQQLGVARLLPAAAGGALFAAVSFVLGVLVSAYGQVLRAHLDTAVHSSPFLNDVERAEVMSLDLGDARAHDQ